VIVAGGVVALTMLAWLYLIRMARSMAAMAMPEMNMWAVPDLSMLVVMWSVMMVAMMLPTAAPMIVLATGAARRRAGPSVWLIATVFLGGYLVAWCAFSVIAAFAQFWLHRMALLSPTMAASSGILGGAILINAGAYQWLPLKESCLAHCRSPMHFVMTEWREGTLGVFAMGLRHGLFCIGCCWALMLLLFFAGVMNLVWVAALSILVLVEKVVRAGPIVGRLTGAALVVWGVIVIAARGF